MLIANLDAEVQHPKHLGWFPSSVSLTFILSDFASSSLASTHRRSATMRWWLLFTAACLLAARALTVPRRTRNGPAYSCGASGGAEAAPASDVPEELVDQFDFEAAIGGVA